MEISYFSNVKNNYVVLKNSELLVNDYKLNMLMKNSIKGFLKLSIGCVDGEVEISYEVSSKQSLKELFDRKKMSYEELYIFIEGLIKVIKNSNLYLLKINEIILDPELIFTNYEVSEIWFCYYPNLNKNFCEEIKKLSGDLLSYTDHSDAKAVNLIYSFYDICSKKEISLGELEGCLEKVRENIYYEEEIYTDTNYDKVCEESDDIYGNLYDLDREKNINLVGKNFLKKIVEKVLKKDFSKDSKDNKKNENELEIEYKEEEENLHEEREYISETMYISELFEHSDRKLLSLSEKDNINISTYPFIIGKLSTRADYIFKDNLISRMHLKIIKEEGNYYIEDMNSKNGTFINDIRLIPYKKEKVDIGDKIRIAKYDYIFR